MAKLEIKSERILNLESALAAAEREEQRGVPSSWGRAYFARDNLRMQVIREARESNSSPAIAKVHRLSFLERLSVMIGGRTD